MTTNFGGVTREGKLLYLTFFKVCENDFLVFKGITDVFDFLSLGGAKALGLVKGGSKKNWMRHLGGAKKFGF